MLFWRSYLCLVKDQNKYLYPANAQPSVWLLIWWFWSMKMVIFGTNEIFATAEYSKIFIWKCLKRSQGNIKHQKRWILWERLHVSRDRLQALNSFWVYELFTVVTHWFSQCWSSKHHWEEVSWSYQNDTKTWSFWKIDEFMPGKINVEPKNGGLEDDFPF